MKIADRIQNLGTETAFLVSAEAAYYRATGQRIYPFHLGDMNIITPANIIEATHQAMRDGKTGYCSNYGLAELRELLAADMNGPRGTGYTIDNVVIQPGGKPSIGKLLMALMNPAWPRHRSALARRTLSLTMACSGMRFRKKTW